MDFKEGSTFPSWESFSEAFERFKDETYQPLIIASTRTSASANQRIKEGKAKFSEAFKYAYVEFQCTHRGIFKSKSEGQRTASSFKSGCLAKVYASVDKVSQRVIVRTIKAEHNHEISHSLYSCYPKQRLLHKRDEADLANLCKLKVSNKLLRQHVKEHYGKNLRLKDISNIKSRVRADVSVPQEDLPYNVHEILNLHTTNKTIDGAVYNDAQLLLTRIAEEQEKDVGATVCVGVEEDRSTLRYLFYQSSLMKSKFDIFPEHVLVDSTYCLNDRQMPLLSFMCVDGNLESHVIALALICEESKDMLSLIFDILRTHNPCTERLKTFMVDKDMNEISCLQTAFPNVSIELCLFHVQKAMKKKISELVCDKRVKDNLRECCSKVCYARSEHEYEVWKLKLLECHSEFAIYFLEHWDSMRDKWVQFERSQHLNFNNRTNNRLESYHQKLKSEVPRNASLDIMFDNILLVLETLNNEISHREFQTSMKQTSYRQYPLLQKELTPFAFSHAIAELNKARTLDCEVCDDCVIVRDGGERVVRDSVCDCSVFVSRCLPCRHVMASCMARGMEPLNSAMFSPRWMRCNQNIAAPPIDNSEVTVQVQASNVSRPWSKSKKFNTAKVLCLKIADKMSELGMSSFLTYLDQLRQFDQNISTGTGTQNHGLANVENESSEELQLGETDRTTGAETGEDGMDRDRLDFSRGNFVVSDGENGVDENCRNGIDIDSDSWDRPNVGSCNNNSGDGVGEDCADRIDVVYNGEDALNSSNATCEMGIRASALCDLIKTAKPPLGLGKRGRPKGSGLTVLGGERKRKKGSSGKLSQRVCLDTRKSSRSTFHSSHTFSVSDVEMDDFSSATMSRSDFFSLVQDILSSCQSFDELCIAASSLSQSMISYPLPRIKPRKVGEVGEVDILALKCLQEATPDFNQLLLPVKVSPDGNCVPRSLSVLFFGNQDYHIEVRCRIVIELANNSHDFLNLPQEDLNFLCQFSDCLCSTPIETFQQETLQVSKSSVYMGMWQLMAAARVFQTPIMSVYPSLGPKSSQTFFNRTLHPSQVFSQSPSSPCAVYWYATEAHEQRLPREHWTANHVVPLVSR